MSRNRNLRNLAGILPETTLVKGNTIMTDGYNNPLTVNHFRTIKKILNEKGEEEAQRYVANILMQEEKRLQAEQRAEERAKTIRIWLNAILGTGGLIAALKLLSWVF